MLKALKKRSLLVLFVSLVSLGLIAPSAAAQQPFKRMVVFGDSLSDPGNAFALLGANATPPDYSLDPFLGLAGSVRPALRSASSGAGNYAIGAATAVEPRID